jgi:hypothetical protein
MPASFPGDSPTPVGRPKGRSRSVLNLTKVPVGETKTNGNERVRHLKAELGLQLELVTRARTKLIAELGMSGKTDLTRDFTSRLKDLTSCFSDLTSARIRLDASEKKLEKEMTPAEERDTAIEYILAMDPAERTAAIQYLVLKSSLGE